MRQASADMSALERQFHAAMLNTYDIAAKKCGYHARAFLRMVQEHGGVEAGHRLLRGSNISSGLMQLKRCDLLGISVEAIVLKPEFGALFSDAERAEARRRLAELNYQPHWDQG